MKYYRIFYMKPEYFGDFIIGIKTPTLAGLEDTHVELKTIMALSRADVFYKMQGEIWSPNGEARNLIRSKGLQHTSMSVGDVLQEVNSGCYYACSRIGWSKL